MQSHVWMLELLERDTLVLEQMLRKRDLAIVAALHSGAPIAEVADACSLTAAEVEAARRRPRSLGSWISPVARSVAAAEDYAAGRPQGSEGVAE